jgi:hypothetical protein
MRKLVRGKALPWAAVFLLFVSFSAPAQSTEAAPSGQADGSAVLDPAEAPFAPAAASPLLPVSPVTPPSIAPVRPSGPLGTDWHSIAKQSLYFLSIQHAFRLATEPGTRSELKGPFFRDWGRSIKGYDGWKDGDPFIVNYVGHPMMGSVAAFLYLQNDPKGRAQTFGMNRGYLGSRLRAMAFAAAYSTLFEMGPVSEASIGNVGLNSKTSGMVDLVVTPICGIGWTIAEDALDRYVVSKLEARIGNRVAKTFLRGLFSPSRGFASMLGGRAPWIRFDRPGIWRPPVPQIP